MLRILFKHEISFLFVYYIFELFFLFLIRMIRNLMGFFQFHSCQMIYWFYEIGIVKKLYNNFITQSQRLTIDGKQKFLLKKKKIRNLLKTKYLRQQLA